MDKGVIADLYNLLDLSSALARALQLVNNATAKGGSNLVQDAIYDAEKKTFGKMVDSSITDTLAETVIDYAKSLSISRHQVERSRLKASEVMISLAPIAHDSKHMREVLGQEISNLMIDERSVVVQLSLKRAQDLLNH